MPFIEYLLCDQHHAKYKYILFNLSYEGKGQEGDFCFSLSPLFFLTLSAIIPLRFFLGST